MHPVKTVVLLVTWYQVSVSVYQYDAESVCLYSLIKVSADFVAMYPKLEIVIIT